MRGTGTYGPGVPWGARSVELFGAEGMRAVRGDPADPRHGEEQPPARVAPPTSAPVTIALTCVTSQGLPSPALRRAQGHIAQCYVVTAVMSIHDGSPAVGPARSWRSPHDRAPRRTAALRHHRRQRRAGGGRPLRHPPARRPRRAGHQGGTSGRRRLRPPLRHHGARRVQLLRLAQPVEGVPDAGPEVGPRTGGPGATPRAGPMCSCRTSPRARPPGWAWAPTRSPSASRR